MAKGGTRLRATFRRRMTRRLGGDKPQAKKTNSQYLVDIPSGENRMIVGQFLPVQELACSLLSFKRPTRCNRNSKVPIIRSFHLGVGLRQIFLLPEF